MEENIITINGVEYTPKAEGWKPSEHVIVIAENGWIFIGLLAEETDSVLRLTDASVVRKWNNGRGIGALALPEYKEEYTLDPIGCGIEVYKSPVNAVLPVEW